MLLTELSTRQEVKGHDGAAPTMHALVLHGPPAGTAGLLFQPLAWPTNPSVCSTPTCLQSPDVHRNIKPQILSAFGDIALAIGDRFEVRGEVAVQQPSGEAYLFGHIPTCCARSLLQHSHPRLPGLMRRSGTAPPAASPTAAACCRSTCSTW